MRPQAIYERSLDVLTWAKEMSPETPTKTGFMLGLGETRDEVLETLRDLKERDINIVTIGQYLRPTPQHLPIVRYATPDEFREYARLGKEMGLRHVESGPLVRSSYHACHAWDLLKASVAAQKRRAIVLPSDEKEARLCVSAWPFVTVRYPCAPGCTTTGLVRLDICSRRSGWRAPPSLSA